MLFSQWRHCRCWKWWLWLVKALDAESVPAFLCPSICQCYSPFSILYMLFLLSLFYWAVCIVWCLLLYCFSCLYLHFLSPFYMPKNSFSSYCTKNYYNLLNLWFLWHLCKLWYRSHPAKKHIQGLIVGKRQLFWQILTYFFPQEYRCSVSSQTETKKYFVL